MKFIIFFTIVLFFTININAFYIDKRDEVEDIASEEKISQMIMIKTKTIPTTGKVLTTQAPIRTTKTIPVITTTTTSPRITSTVYYKINDNYYGFEDVLYYHQNMYVPEDTEDIAVICKKLDYNNPNKSEIPEIVCDYDKNCFRYYEKFHESGDTAYYWEHNRSSLNAECLIYLKSKNNPIQPSEIENITPIDICRVRETTLTKTNTYFYQYGDCTTMTEDPQNITKICTYTQPLETYSFSTIACQSYTNPPQEPITVTGTIPTTRPTPTTTTTTTTVLPSNYKTMSQIYPIYNTPLHYGKEIENLSSFGNTVITVPNEVADVYMKCINEIPPSLRKRANENISDDSSVICHYEKNEDGTDNCYKLYKVESHGQYNYCNIYTSKTGEIIPTATAVTSYLCKPTLTPRVYTTTQFVSSTCTSFKTNNLNAKGCTTYSSIHPVTETIAQCRVEPETTTTTTTTTKPPYTKTIPSTSKITTTTTLSTSTKTIPTSSTTTSTTTLSTSTKTIPTSTKTIPTSSTTTSTTTSTKTIPNTKCLPVTVTKKEKVTITEKETVTVTITSTETNDSQCASKWGQCGGINFSGPTCCKSGLKCHQVNEYYSQCL